MSWKQFWMLNAVSWETFKGIFCGGLHAEGKRRIAEELSFEKIEFFDLPS